MTGDGLIDGFGDFVLGHKNLALQQQFVANLSRSDGEVGARDGDSAIVAIVIKDRDAHPALARRLVLRSLAVPRLEQVGAAIVPVGCQAAQVGLALRIGGEDPIDSGSPSRALSRLGRAGSAAN